MKFVYVALFILISIPAVKAQSDIQKQEYDFSLAKYERCKFSETRHHQDQSFNTFHSYCFRSYPEYSSQLVCSISIQEEYDNEGIRTAIFRVEESPTFGSWDYQRKNTNVLNSEIFWMVSQDPEIMATRAAQYMNKFCVRNIPADELSFKEFVDQIETLSEGVTVATYSPYSIWRNYAGTSTVNVSNQARSLVPVLKTETKFESAELASEYRLKLIDTASGVLLQ